MESTNSGSRKEKSVSLRLVGLKRFVLFCCGVLNCLFYFLFRSRIHVFLVIIIIVIIIIIITIIIFVFILFVYVYLFTPFP